MSVWAALAPSSLPTRSQGRVGKLTGLLRTFWQLKSQTHGPSSESSSQMPPCCRHSSCSHSLSSPEPEPPEPHSAEGKEDGVTQRSLSKDQQLTVAAPELTLITWP